MMMSTDDALLRKAFTDIFNCCDIHFTYILLLIDYFQSDLVWLETPSLFLKCFKGCSLNLSFDTW